MSDLRQQVRRDDDLPPMARLLFAEISQMNEGDGECYAEDEWLGEQIGAAESTVRRHRLTVLDKEYIRQCKSGGRRYLEPNEMINIDQSDQNQSESASNDDQNDQNRSEEVINTDQHRGNNNPEGMSERAPACEDSSGDVFERLVNIWRDVGSAPPLSEGVEDVLWDWAQEGKIPDVPLFRDVLERDAAAVKAQGKGLNMGVLLDRYTDELESGKLEPWQAESDDWSVNEDGKVCFKGVPVEETGPQDVYAERKDGSRQPEPEVSAS